MDVLDKEMFDSVLLRVFALKPLIQQSECSPTAVETVVEAAARSDVTNRTVFAVFVSSSV